MKRIRVRLCAKGLAGLADARPAADGGLCQWPFEPFHGQRRKLSDL